MADVIIVGGGIAGLTAAAYLTKNGKKVKVLERSQKAGGLVGSFVYKGFTFDSGIRAVENSGALLPMMRQLGIELPLTDNTVSIGAVDTIIELHTDDYLEQYSDLLKSLYPKQKDEIDRIIKEISVISKYMDVLYGIDNPLFLDVRENSAYFLKVILPWLVKYGLTIRKIERLKMPVRQYLRQFTSSQSLIDFITQHFFEDTPAFFALSYLRMYTDYHYPVGGVGKLADALTAYITANGGHVKYDAGIVKIDADKFEATDQNGTVYPYSKLIWAADLKALYTATEVRAIKDTSVLEKYNEMKKSVMSGSGNGSIFTMFLTTDVPPDYFAEIATEHFFYTPVTNGLSTLPAPSSLGIEKEVLSDWLADFARLTTYEISIPSLRDPSLSPPGKTGLIVSTVFDYSLTQKISDNGWYDEFKSMFCNHMVDALDASIFPGLKQRALETFASTPLTLSERYNNTAGAITGWSFSSAPPIEDRMTKIAQSVKTPLNGIYQCGQWVFSPSGLPTSIITGKLAADLVLRDR